MIHFPHSDLNKTLLFMYEKQTYKKMVLYIKAFLSGSMFVNYFPEELNIYEITSYNPD